MDPKARSGPDPTNLWPHSATAVLCQRISSLPSSALQILLGRYGLTVTACPAGAAIPGSYWGAPEAGLIQNHLYVAPETPVHSALHEACHVICMDAARRLRLHTDAGGDDDEEIAVCYLQVVMADHLAGYSSRQMMRDMDCWGYSFRLGSALAWYVHDADGPRKWLERRRPITSAPDGTVSL